MNPRQPPKGAPAKLGTSPAPAPSTQADGRGVQPIAAPSPALPKAGGGVRGLGEKYAVNAAMGTGSFRAPIAVSGARDGFQPSLSLDYAPNRGNSTFGVGWSLRIGDITRKTDKGLPVYGGPDGSDVFILSGEEDLVPVRREDGTIERVEEGNEIVERYRPRTEGAFARIERRWLKAGGGFHAATWKVVSRDNVTSIYGRSEQARIADPSSPGRVFSWLLEEMRDDRGNIIVFEYKAEDLRKVPRNMPHEQNRLAGHAPITNRYIKRIRYGNTVPGDPSTTVFEVVFDYGEHDKRDPAYEEVNPWPCRQDPFSFGRAGFEIRTYRLCRRILMFHRMQELDPSPCLVASTDLTHVENPSGTLLTAVRGSRYKRSLIEPAYIQRSFQPYDFGYSAPKIRSALQILAKESAPELGGGLQGPHQWTDINGEGLPGFLMRQAGTLFYKANLGDGKLGPALQLPTSPSLGVQGGLLVSDIDGDGRKEMVFFERPMAGYHERTDDGSWAPRVPFASQPNIDWADRNLQFIDLSGDGRDDVLIARGSSLVWYRSLGKGGFDKPITLPAPRDEDNKTPMLVFASGTQRLFLADMTGDGLMDIVRVRNGGVCYWPNLGYGKFGARVEMSYGPWLDYPDHFDLRRVRLTDVNGLGTADLIYLNIDKVCIYINQSGNSFAKAIELPSLPDHSPLSNIEVFDLLGTGTACLVWSSAFPGFARAPVRYIDLFSGEKPYLLTSIKNNHGLETRIRYAPSTKFYLADRAAGRPWVTKLPFPVHVVERVETYDYISRVRLISEYRYHHGRYDGHEREFCGFGMVEQVDTEAFSAPLGQGLFPEVTPRNCELPQPPALTKTWFHTGAWERGKAISRQYEKEYYALDPDAPRLPDTLLLDNLSAEEQRQACRALRGQMLREESYALDGSPAEPHPYAVTENSFAVRRVLPARGPSPGVFFVVPRETISLAYDRYRDAEGRPDPRVAHGVTLVVDDVGTVRKSVAMAYPRRRVPVDPAYAAQGQLFATLTEVDVVHLDGLQNGYRLGIPVESRAYELHGLASPRGGFSFEALALAVAAADAQPIGYEAPVPAGTGKRLIQRHRFRYYDSANLPSPLPLGSADLQALPYESYELALTSGQITQTINANEERVTPAILAEGGYVELPGDSGFWIPSGRQVFDPARFYLPTSTINPFGATSTAEYDAYALLVTRTEDALGNQTIIDNDYRLLLPAMITDANGNRSAVRFDELGRVIAEAVMGKEGSTDGDTLDYPSTMIWHDETQFRELGRPNYVRIRRRETHGDQTTRWLDVWIYFDGAGKEILRKERVEPGLVLILDADGRLVRGPDGKPRQGRVDERWVGSGRAVFDNKGNPIKQYESYFSNSPDYDPEEELTQWGVTPLFRYDPLSRLVRIDLPNGTCRRVEFTPWDRTSWDENDTVLDPGNLWYAERRPGATPAMSEAEQRAARLAATHAGTPTVEVLDPLGRVVLTIEDLGGARTPQTRKTLDIEGQELVVTDARGNDVVVRTFDVAGRAIHEKSIDAGERWMLLDVLGNPLRRWDSRGHRHRAVYDMLRRRTELWVQEAGAPEILTERTIYGEQHPEAVALNLRGKVYQQYDSAGLVTNEACDFKGNVLASTRRLAVDYKSQPDWSQSPTPALRDEVFPTSTVYDALNRPTVITTPDGSEVRPKYNEAGLLQAVDIKLWWAASPISVITGLTYNAKGQRERITYGNGVSTDYAYHPLTFRLVGIKTTRASDGALLHDLRYTHHPVGNIVETEDRVQKTVYRNGDAVEPICRHEYDALYRLTRTEGREHAGQNADIQQDERGFPLVNAPHPNDPQALRNYTELFQYDDVGNILSMIHQAVSGSWTRRYEVAREANRLLSTSLPGDPEAGPYTAKYTHDAHGNMTSMPHLAHITWDDKDQMREVDLGGGGKVYFVYNAFGERVRKIWEHSGIIEERIYLGGYELYLRREGAAQELVLERQTLHVMDDAKRVALVETKTVDTSAPPFMPTPRIRYQLDNHLGSAMLELDDTGQVISYEEYHAYGTTAYHAVRSDVEVSSKRYRYTGKERDEETGLYYHGARYYAPWLGRWTSADPAGIIDGPNSYLYVRANPVRLIDPTGFQSAGPTRTPWNDWTEEGAAHVTGFTADLLPIDEMVITDPLVVTPTKPKPPPPSPPTSQPQPSEGSESSSWKDNPVVQFGAGALIGGLQGWLPFGFIGNVVSMPTRTSELGRGVGEAAMGVAQMIGGIGAIIGGGGAAAGGAVAAPVTGGASALVTVAGGAAVVAGWAAVAQGATNVVAGVGSVSHAMSMSSGSGSGGGAPPASPAAAPQPSPARPGNPKGVEIVDARGASLGEFDEIAPGRFIEDKSATGVGTPNPKTGRVHNTPADWAKKQIFDKTKTRINNLTMSATATRPTPGGSPTVPTLAEIRSIRAIHFRIYSAESAIQAAVNAELANLRALFPGWTFTAQFGP
jgi:RHS repeat-associated protein